MRNQTFITALVLTDYCFLLLSAVSFAQTKFQIAIGGSDREVKYGYSDAKQTSDGGYIIVTHRTTPIIAGSSYLYLLKTDANGTIVWTKMFDAGTVGSAVQQTSDGGYIISGFNLVSGNLYDIFLLKTDGSGTILWSKSYGGTNYEYGSYLLKNSVQQTSDGGYIIGGTTTSFGAGNSDMYLLKTDGSGTLLWSKTFGGASAEEGYSVQQANDGGYIITGYTASFGAGNWDLYLVKTDASGNISWSRAFGGTDWDEGYSVKQTSDGGYIVSGRTKSFGQGGYDVYLLKTDASGNLTWSKTFGSAGNEFGNSVQQTADGGFVIAGLAPGGGIWSDAYLVKTDGNGDLLWSRKFGGNGQEEFLSIQQTSDGGYIISGYTSSYGAGDIDIYLIKTD